jgi:AcrR family transcriptional regulator
LVKTKRAIPMTAEDQIARRADAIAPQRVPLSKELVLRTAIGLADRDGIDALTMRRLAHELGVEAMSLYYYVANKDELLSAMLDIVTSEIEVPSAEADWKTAIRRSAVSFHDALGRHRWATSVLMSGPPGVGPAQLRYSDALLRRLRESGLPPELSHRAYHALDSHIVGSTLWAAGISAVMKANPDAVQKFIRDLPRAEYPDFANHVDQHMTKSVRTSGKSEFEFGLDLILDGLEQMHDAMRKPTRRNARGKAAAPRS